MLLFCAVPPQTAQKTLNFIKKRKFPIRVFSKWGFDIAGKTLYNVGRKNRKAAGASIRAATAKDTH